MRALYWILAGALAALAGLFALNNRGDLTVDLWPVGPELQMPVFVALVGALYLGFALGAVVWMRSCLNSEVTRFRYIMLRCAWVRPSFRRVRL